MLRSSRGTVAEPRGESAVAGDWDKDQGEIPESIRRAESPLRKGSPGGNSGTVAQSTSIPTAKCLLFGRLVCAPLYYGAIGEWETKAAWGRTAQGADDGDLRAISGVEEIAT